MKGEGPRWLPVSGVPRHRLGRVRRGAVPNRAARRGETITGHDRGAGKGVDDVFGSVFGIVPVDEAGKAGFER